MQKLVNIQKNSFNKLNNPLKIDINYRIYLLKKLKNTILKNQKEISKVVYKDLGRLDFITYTVETYFLISELNYFIKNLKKLSKVKKVKTPLISLGCQSYIKYSPYGTVLIISPWNYPFLLSLSPLIGAISAGNTVILKPSEHTENCSNLLKKIVNEAFPKKYAEVVLGDYNKVTNLIDLKMDFIFFTGSTNIGKIIMEKASKNLTPISLELGGKNPCILDKTVNLKTSVKRIAWGKILNAGQTCVSPDYIILPEDLLNDFIINFKNTIYKFFGFFPTENEQYMPIV
ncbi:MAG: aldehyde dehydrogenase family protein, partial [Eubacteriales bacterium]|nr:aldehyde dehydrogenase family protein [Eubacteriales bacterium]